MSRALAVFFLLLVGLTADPAAAREIPEDLALEYRTWLEEVDLLITDEEWAAFLELEKDYQRDGFITRFWQARDPVTRTERNEFKDEWSARVDTARDRYGSLGDARSRILLLNDEPASTLRNPCSQHFRPLELWAYSQLPGFLILVFVEPAKDALFQLWDPNEGVFELLRDSPVEIQSRCSTAALDPDVTGMHVTYLQEAEVRCLEEQLAAICPFDHEELHAYLSRVARLEPAEFNQDLQRVNKRPRAREDEWLATFAAHSTDLPEGAAELPARLEIFFPGRRSARTVVQGVLAVPAVQAVAVELAGRESLDFQLTGEVLRKTPRGDELFESFRYRFDLPLAQLAGDEAPLVFQRFLRPGTYELIVKLEDVHSGRFFRRQTTLEVPKLGDAPPPLPADAQSARLLEEAARALSGGETSLRLVPPKGDGARVGSVRFDTVAAGGGFARVAFFLDGKKVLSKRRPPYSVELDLGRVPRLRTVRVVGYGDDGRELARDEIEVNAGRNRFAVRLVEPQPGKTYGTSLLARAEVDVPEGQQLERLEIYLGEQRLATLYQPPFEQALLLDGSDELTYVRAKAYLDDGNAAEDVVFVNAPDYMDELDVQLVELYASVVDGQGRPVEGLEAADFAVAEDGVAQEIVRFEQVRDLAVHVGIVVDGSASMAERLADVRRAALAFFADILTPKDRAAVVTFNDQPRLTVGFTNQIEEAAREMAGMKAEGGTALWDSVVFTLQYFNGVTGQRAILLLSDGEDRSSRFAFDEALGYAHSAGVALYAIGLDAPKLTAARPRLNKLADATGGRSYFVSGVAKLGEIYAQIQRELRSKYLIVYQSSATGDGFRRVELRTSRSGLEVKTIQGYYP